MHASDVFRSAMVVALRCGACDGFHQLQTVGSCDSSIIDIFARIAIVVAEIAPNPGDSSDEN